MIARCKHCGQPALDTDKVCWHCGRPLAGRDVEAPDKIAVNKGWHQTQSLGTISGYVAVAVFVIVAVVLVTGNLGQQPRVAADVGEQVPEGWEIIRDFEGRFTFYLPEGWSWFERERREERSQPPLSRLIEQEQFFLAGMEPLGAETDDLVVDFLAVPLSDTAVFEGETAAAEALVTAEAFMLVAFSERLNSTTYDETARFLLNSDYPVVRAEVERSLDESFLAIVTETPVSAAGDFEYLDCVQRFILGSGNSLLVTLCAKNTVYAGYQQLFNEILAGFHRLS